MQPLRYAINLTLDGRAGHESGAPPDAFTHRHAAESLSQNDSMLLGRTTYELMEFWRDPPAGLPEWTRPFANVIGPMKKYVVSSTLEKVDWRGAELVRGELGAFVRALKQQPGRGIATGGLRLPLALAELGLIDEYEFTVHPRISGSGPTLFSGLSKFVDLKLVKLLALPSGFVVLTYVPRETSAADASPAH